MTDDKPTLHRQVHPSWVQDGRITSQAFGPTPKDVGLLSVYDGQQIAAEASFIHYTNVQKLTAIGTMSVTTEEVTAVELPSRFPSTQSSTTAACRLRAKSKPRRRPLQRRPVNAAGPTPLSSHHLRHNRGKLYLGARFS